MKKPIAIVLSILMMVGLFAGCTNPADASSQSAAPDAAPSESSTADAASESAAPVAEGSLKVALLIPGLLGDKSFFDAARASIPLLEQSLGAETKVVEMGTDQTKWYPTFVDYSEQDYDLIVTISDPVNDVLLEVAEEYPDQKYMNIDSSMEFDIPQNLYVMVSKMGEMSFLAGLAGALKAQELGSDRIGFIGGLDIPGINEFLIGYIDGAQHINPDIKVAYSYVGSFTDPSKAKENALIMYTDIPVIYQAAGASGLGVFDAAKEMTAKGTPRFAIGVDSDQAMELKDSDPDAANLIITSAVKQIPEYTLDAVTKFTKNELAFGTKNYVGLKEHAVSIAKNEFYEKLLSAEDRKRIDEIEAKVVSGETETINTINMPAEEVEKIRTSVRP